MKLFNHRYSADALGLAIAAGLAAVVYVAGFKPAQAGAQERSAQQQSLNELERDAAAKAQDLRDSRAQVSVLEVEQANAVKLAPATMRNERVRRIGELAADAGITITNLTPREAERGERISRVPIGLTGSGTALSFQGFLRWLHAEFADMQVESFSILSTPDSSEQGAAVGAELIWFTQGEGRAGSAGANMAAEKKSP